MSGLSGNEGSVTIDTTEVAKIINWDATLTVQQTKRVTSATAPWESQTTGNKGVAGSFTIQISATGGLPLALSTALLAGTEIDLDLTQITGKSLSGPAKLGEMSLSADVDGAEDQQATYPFVSNGAWTLPSDA